MSTKNDLIILPFYSSLFKLFYARSEACMPVHFQCTPTGRARPVKAGNHVSLNAEKIPAKWYLEPQATYRPGMHHEGHTLTGMEFSSAFKQQ